MSLAQNSAGALDEAWGTVFLMGVAATLVCLVVYLATRRGSMGRAALGYALISIGIALFLFLDMPVVGTLVAIPGVALFLHWYSQRPVRR